MTGITRNNPWVKELLMLIPNLAILVGKLALDNRVPTETKVTLGAAALYLVSPIDGVPDFVPIVGQLDDIIMVLLIIDGVINHIDPELVKEHWRGDPALLTRAQSIAARLTSFVPGFIKDRFFERAFHSKAAKPFHMIAGRSGRQGAASQQQSTI